MEYKELQLEILKRAKKENACKEEYQKAYKAESFDELLKVVAENFSWCYERKVIDSDILDIFGNDKVNEIGIYYKGEYKKLESKNIIALCGDIVVGILDSSQVGKMFDSSQVGEMWCSSQVGKMFDSSQVGKMFDSSQVGEMWGSSQVGEMFDSSQVGEMWDSSQVGKMWGSSQVGEMFGGSSYRCFNGFKCEKINDNVILIDYINKTIVTASEFKIE